jgi:hypothetical protein
MLGIAYMAVSSYGDYRSAAEIKFITLHCIIFPGSKVSQIDCRMWNMSYK